MATVLRKSLLPVRHTMKEDLIPGLFSFPNSNCSLASLPCGTNSARLPLLSKVIFDPNSSASPLPIEKEDIIMKQTFV